VIDLFINPMFDETSPKIKKISALRHGVSYYATAPASAGLPTSIPEHTFDRIEGLIDHLE